MKVGDIELSVPSWDIPSLLIATGELDYPICIEQSTMKDLLPYLQRFVETGKLEEVGTETVAEALRRLATNCANQESAESETYEINPFHQEVSETEHREVTSDENKLFIADTPQFGTYGGIDRSSSPTTTPLTLKEAIEILEKWRDSYSNRVWSLMLFEGNHRENFCEDNLEEKLLSLRKEQEEKKMPESGEGWVIYEGNKVFELSTRENTWVGDKKRIKWEVVE